MFVCASVRVYVSVYMYTWLRMPEEARRGFHIPCVGVSDGCEPCVGAGSGASSSGRAVDALRSRVVSSAPGYRFPITLRSSSPILAASLHLLIILCLGLFVSDSEFLLLCFHFVPVYIFSFCAKFFFPHSWGFRLNCERNLSWESLCHDYLTTLFLVILTRILVVIAYRMSLHSSRS